ncbi:hypothetical protein N7509_000901 [Penicillium cosmopolitanum]|uniref:Uncharacterized protein n=1 Tax=Penicillium cosmopolitanum TaxID=1131564 RepID=A0A9X0BEN3_9EURO|nr:uncharacterized protein N7509_000901 [Penicillium cosmopolitanum]KAJ5414274.1 hypothetical protein N7509_000901 [Penicillium cosmopolitanum]
MAGKKPPRPAMVEDYDEEFDDIVPESRQVANTAAKVVTRSDHRFPAEPLIDGASDSGYSSRTAATANSTQSGPSGGKSPPVPHKLHMPKQRADLDRKSSTRREPRERKERQDRPRPGHEESMRVGAYPGPAQYHSHVPRSPSKSRSRRDSSARHYQDPAHYYEGGPVYHQQQPPTPIDRYPPNMEYPPAMYGRPPMPDMVPSSPRTYAPRQAYGYEEYHRPTNRSHRSHSYRQSGGYHQDSRPMSMSFHETSMGPPGLYHPQVPYDPYGPGGPPPSHSAYYASSPYGGGSFTGYAGSEFPASLEYGPERSPSRTREPSRRRNSIYDPRMMESDDVFAQEFEEYEPLERYSSREPRGRHSSKPTQPRDEDYYRDVSRMPPPPLPKSRAAPKIIQNKRPEGPRKAQTVQAVPSAPSRRMSRAAADHAAEFMDMSDMRNALPDPAHRRLSREAGMAPERSQSMRESRRSNSYHDTGRGARIAVENSRRRRPERAEQYYYDDNDSRGDELEDQVSNVEQYQNAKAGRSATAALPASTESLIPKMVNGAGSDSGSRKSGSNSSRESGTGSKAGGKDISLMMDGIQLGFKEEAVHGKMINIRSDDAGGFHLSLGGNANRKPKAYLPAGSSYSDKTGTASRRELVEDVRRTRDDRRVERGSRRSSQSTYGRRY